MLIIQYKVQHYKLIETGTGIPSNIQEIIRAKHSTIGTDETWVELGIAKKLSRFDTWIIASGDLIDSVRVGDIMEITRKSSFIRRKDAWQKSTYGAK